MYHHLAFLFRKILDSAFCFNLSVRFELMHVSIKVSHDMLSDKTLA